MNKEISQSVRDRPWSGGAVDLRSLARVVQGWPGWLMLVGPDRRVLARSTALMQGLEGAGFAGADLVCTQLVHTDVANHCCLDFGAAITDCEASVLVQARARNGFTRAVSARLERIVLPDGVSAWLVHLDPYDARSSNGAAAAWREVVAMRREAGLEETAWLAQLTQRWVQPLVQPYWTGWVRENASDGANCCAASGRLGCGLTHAMICTAVAEARLRVDHDLPLTIQVTDEGGLLHLIPSGPAPGWVLALLGGHVDGARAAMLRGLLAAVAAVKTSRSAAHSTGAGSLKAAALHNLTEREAGIVQLVAQGLPDKRIAQHLGLSFHTVRNHLRRIMHKLRVNTRAQIAFALAGQPDNSA